MPRTIIPHREERPRGARLEGRTARLQDAAGAGVNDGRAVGGADYLLSAAAVRERCAIVLAAAERGETRHFRLVPARLDNAVERVVAVTRRRYPDLAVPLHSRWRHFGVGGIDRASLVAPGADRAEAARAQLDLAIVSVLLDAGAGPGWVYREAESGQVVGRSEGLAVASLRAMQAGLFSADPNRKWRADAAALAGLSADRLGRAFPGYRPRICWASCCGRSGRSGRAALCSMACRSAIAGATARLPATASC